MLTQQPHGSAAAACLQGQSGLQSIRNMAHCTLSMLLCQYLPHELQHGNVVAAAIALITL
jgi:hypothetical protein